MAERQTLRFCTSSDGVRLAYATLGRGPPLVKAPNWHTHLEHECKSPLWRHWLQGLSRRHSFIRYDARGCGLSDRDPPELTFESWVRDLEAVVDATGLERFPLLGISGGGPIAIAYAHRHPERVSQLILYGSFARGRLKRGGGQAAKDEAAVMQKLAELGWGTSKRAFRQMFARQFLPDGSPELIDAFDELQRQSSSVSPLRIMTFTMDIEITGLAAAIDCPTLILHATDDELVPFEEGRVLASLIPGSRFVPLESRNHILLEAEPAWQRFLDEVDEFLSPHGLPEAFARLTARERELLDYLARGLDNHQIAAHAGVSEKTVRNHVSAILGKVGVESRAQAIVAAREAGFGSGPAG